MDAREESADRETQANEGDGGEFADDAPFLRYEVQGEVGRGAMGVVYRVRDEELDRDLAMKVLLEKSDGQDGLDSVERRKLARFLEEAKITGQLDHPGIVPVHELGMDELGRTYFTMRLVQGQGLDQLIDRVHAGTDEDWTLTRAVGIVLRVCEAVAFAHERGVIHRDIKPSNVMVGGLGETYVMDWGLAKSLSREDPHDIRLRTEPETFGDGDGGDDDAGDSLATMDGHIVGTPAYMAPEQARGEIGHVGPAADVYSLGALLYHVLAGVGPYMQPGERPVVGLVLEAVCRRPPEPIEQRAPNAPPQVQAICAKAMQREPADRYGNVAEMADDLRAYLEGRVVKAYESGAAAEFRSWVRRNRALAASIAAGLLAVIVGLAAVSVVESRGRRAEQRERARAELALETSDALAKRNQRFADGAHAQSLTLRERDLWPVHADTVPAMDAWLAEARPLITNAADTRRALEELRARAREYSPEQRQADLERIRVNHGVEWPTYLNMRAVLPAMSALLRRDRSELGRDDPEVRKQEAEHQAAQALFEKLRAIYEQRLTYEFASVADRRDHAELSEIVEKLGHLSGVYEHVEKRRDLAAVIEARSLTGDDARVRWDDALAYLAAHPPYSGLELEPIHGLLPLGRDIDSGLLEFAHLPSGEPPQWDDEGQRYVLSEETGVVLVLIPGGSFFMGCSTVEGGPNEDPDCTDIEGPVMEVTLDAFFISKYELTRAQWLRVNHEDPSFCITPGNALELVRPVEQVTWYQGAKTFEKYGLALPTEAQWEFACRARTNSVYSFGDDVARLRSFGNVADQQLLIWASQTLQGAAEWNDGFHQTAPVGSFDPNLFGLYDMHGNVGEYCIDDFVTSVGSPLRSSTGRGIVRSQPENPYAAQRGGSWQYPPTMSRSADRRRGGKYAYRHSASADVGVRPVRMLP